MVTSYPGNTQKKGNGNINQFYCNVILLNAILFY